MTTLLADARLGWRGLRRHPGWTTVAVATLAIGIGASSAIFSVVYATYLAPLPYRDPERLVVLWSQREGQRNLTAIGDLLDWQERSRSFEGLVAFGWKQVALATAERPEEVQAGPTTPGLFSVLGYGQPMALGRPFTPEETRVGSDTVAVLSHRLWQQRFGGDPDIVGSPVRIDGVPHIVVGVLSPGPPDRNSTQLWLPLAVTPEQRSRLSHDHSLLVLGRLREGVTLDEANAEMAVIARDIANADPETNEGWSVSVEPFRNNFVAEATLRALWLLVAAVAFLLLIACVNVANLLLARTRARRRELAVRVALGASRERLFRQLVTESLVLASLGAVVGVALAYALVRAIVALVPPDTLPTEAEIAISVPVLLFSAVVCVGAGVLFGSAPAWRGARTDVNEALKGAGRGLAAAGHAVPRGLVVVEFALALTLLTGGALAVQALTRLMTLDLGFRAERLLTLSLPVPDGRLDGDERILGFYEELADRIEALPGVESMSVSTSLPLRRGRTGVLFSIRGEPVADPSQRPWAGLNRVGVGYFDTLDIHLTRGRAFGERDRVGAPPVAIVSETFVSRYLPGVDPLGQRIVVEEVTWGDDAEVATVEREIIGVHADVRMVAARYDPFPMINVPFAQSPASRTNVAVRARVEPGALQRPIARIVESMLPGVPLGDVRSMDRVVADHFAPERFHTTLFAWFGAMGLLLATVGIYGVMSFAVAQRTGEVGVRLALGADRRRILRLILREGALMALAGIAFGGAGAWAVGRWMRGLLFGIEGVGPATGIGVTLTLLGAALVASLVPARRAAAVDPVVALREE